MRNNERSGSERRSDSPNDNRHAGKYATNLYRFMHSQNSGPFFGGNATQPSFRFGPWFVHKLWFFVRFFFRFQCGGIFRRPVPFILQSSLVLLYQRLIVRWLFCFMGRVQTRKHWPKAARMSHPICSGNRQRTQKLRTSGKENHRPFALAGHWQSSIYSLE